MSMIRKANKKRYTSISNQLAQDHTISLKARGLMLYFLSLPDDWEVHVTHLYSVLKEGKTSIRSALVELKEGGYIYLIKDGFNGGWKYFVFEEKITEEEFKEFLKNKPILDEKGLPTYPKPKLSETDAMGNRQLLNTNSNTKDVSLRKEDPPPKTSPTFLEVRTNVKLSTTQHKTLLDKHGEDDLNLILDKLSEYKTVKGKIYKSDYLAIQRWVVEWLEDRNSQSEAGLTLIENNKKAWKEIYSHLERTSTRGQPYCDKDGAGDSLFNKHCVWNHPKLPHVVSGWYKLEWED